MHQPDGPHSTVTECLSRMPAGPGSNLASNKNLFVEIKVLLKKKLKEEDLEYIFLSKLLTSKNTADTVILTYLVENRHM